MKKNNSHFTYRTARSFLNDISCAYDPGYAVEYRFDTDSDGGLTRYDLHCPVGSKSYKPIQVIIGVGPLIDDVRNGFDSDSCLSFDDVFVSDRNAVLSVFNLCHELGHVDQYCRVFQKSDPSFVEQAAARECVIGHYFPSLYWHAYSMDISETLANMSAVRDTFSFFRDRFPDVDVDGILVERAARAQGLRAKIRTTVSNFDVCETAEDVYNVYGALSGIFAEVPKYHISELDDSVLSNPKLRERDPKLYQFLSTKSVYLSDAVKARTAFDEEDALCRYIVSKEPEYFKAVPCVERDYKPKPMSKAMVWLNSLHRNSNTDDEKKPNGPEIDQ